MLNVTETTIKRWTDDNLIECVRTPGGHRKFPLKGIVRFADANGYELSGTTPPELSPERRDELLLGIHTGDFDRIARVFQQEALDGNRAGVVNLLLYLYKRRIPFTVILDEIVRPAFAAVGRDWKEGFLQISREHAASQVTTESLVSISPELLRKKANGLSALLACPGEEFHEIGLRGLAYSLEAEGWHIHFLGGNTPFDALASFIGIMRPQLVCLSVTTDLAAKTLPERVSSITEQVHSFGGKVILGGHYASQLNTGEVHCDHIASSIQDAISYTRRVFGSQPGKTNNKAPLVKKRGVFSSKKKEQQS